jgi:hypothetical protein
LRFGPTSALSSFLEKLSGASGFGGGPALLDLAGREGVRPLTENEPDSRRMRDASQENTGKIVGEEDP